MKKCYIVCAGEDCGIDFVKKNGDIVIAADAGLKYLIKYGIEPDITVGDFDTLQYVPKGENVIKLNPEKDETDAFAAIRLGLERGYTQFYFYCATGGKTEHTFANIQLLTFLAERNLQGFLFDRDSVLTAIKDGEYTFDETASGRVSVFSLTEKTQGVYLENLKYPLANAELTSSFPLGISNEFIGKKGRIKAEKGVLLLVLPRKTSQY